MTNSLPGHLITLSGLDGAGKTTQITALREHLEDRGQRCIACQFGAQDFGAESRHRVRSILAADTQWVFTRLRMDWAGRCPLLDAFVHQASLHTHKVSLAAALMFAGGSLQVAEFGLRPLLDAGVNVVCDRYWFDDLAFRTLWVEQDLIERIYCHVLVPDIAFLLDVPPERCETRNRGRPDEQNPILSDPAMVRRLHRKFEDIGRAHGLARIDGDRSIEDVARDIRERIAALLAARCSTAARQRSY